MRKEERERDLSKKEKECPNHPNGTKSIEKITEKIWKEEEGRARDAREERRPRGVRAQKKRETRKERHRASRRLVVHSPEAFRARFGARREKERERKRACVDSKKKDKK